MCAQHDTELKCIYLHLCVLQSRDQASFATGLAAFRLGLNGGEPVQQMRQAFQDRRVSSLPCSSFNTS